MKDWIVETRVVSRRVYLVQAEDEREAIFSSTHLPPQYDEDEYEETMSVVENTEGHGGLDRQARNPVGLPDSSGDLASAGGIAGVDITDHRRQVGMPRDALVECRSCDGAGAVAPEGDRCEVCDGEGLVSADPVAQWRAFYSVAYPKLWGIETDDPAAVEAGLEIVVAPCMPEHAAKDIARAWNKKNTAPASAPLGEDRA